MRDTRIQKVLAEQGVCSRRAAEQLIREGRVKLNGRPVALGDKMDTRDGDKFCWNLSNGKNFCGFLIFPTTTCGIDPPGV